MSKENSRIFDPQFDDSLEDTHEKPSLPSPQLTKRAERDQAVRDAVREEDWDSLTKLSSLPGGFQDARSVAWPYLLHATPLEAASGSKEDNNEPSSSKPHRDERQVGLDTNRAFVHYPVESQHLKDKRKKQLTELILGVLEEHPQLSYFQGYHDIISTLQLTLHPSLEPDEETMRVLRACAVKISLHRTRDAMGKGLEPLTGQLRILRRLLRLVDPDYARLIEESVSLPYWAISSLMTLYTHDLPTLALAQRVTDWILCRPPDAVIYLVAAFTLEKKKDVQQLIDEGDDGMMHSELCSLPELEADELEFEPEVKVTATPPVDPPPAYDTLVSTAQSLVSDSTPLHSTTDTPATSTKISPADSTQDLADKDGLDETNNAFTADPEKSDPLPPPSPASSLSSLPLQSPSSNYPRSPTVPLSSILQKADRLRSRYPIYHEYLRLAQTMGPKSMLRTWSRDPKEILSDQAAEEAVLSTEELVLPNQDEDEDEDFPYIPVEPKGPSTRLALLPKIDIGMAIAIGLPMAAAMFMVASNSPTAKARTEQFAALAFNFVEVGMF
ncbi:hypothetical protein BDV93DRAFT_150499 [Ceratobasidium sp. AG-I]|nr:hypothetical protein BDV93DRAFT_150499 [Ceratobasidium sp. AG-I]